VVCIFAFVVVIFISLPLSGSGINAGTGRVVLGVAGRIFEEITGDKVNDIFGSED
jgi:hypothetical protein